MSDTIAAIATGAQVAAIGIVRLSGPEAVAFAERLFRPASGRPLGKCRDRQLNYGRLIDRSGRLLDLCMCTVSRAPHSYTGEDTAEFQCHGSPVLLRTLLEELFALGARQAGPGEFTKRAFLNGRLGLSSAEAVADLIEAESAEAAANAAGQLGGAVSRRAEEVYSRLSDISAHYHAVLDYPDEDIEDFRLERYAASLRDALDGLRAMLDTYDRGRLLNSGVPAVLAGRPNVGKSSLLNALLGYDRAIVTQIPGTTRDTVEGRLRLGGTVLRLTDTAGIRGSADPVERLGVERSRRAISQAELVIAVLDGSRSAGAEDMEIIEAAEKAPKGLVVLSKADLPQAEAPETALPVLRVSSVTGEGLDGLRRRIEGLFPLPDVPAGEIITNARQAEAISRAASAMEAALEAMEAGATPDIVLTETEAAMASIGELDGRTVREDVTERIFSRFCVGK